MPGGWSSCAAAGRTSATSPTSKWNGPWPLVDIVSVADADDLAEFDVALITVPTPLAEGVPDLAPIRSAAERVGRLVRPGCLVVLESTTYPGTTDELLAPALEAASGLKAGVDFHVGYSPERIDPGNTEWTLVRIPKVVAGLTPECLAMVEAFYGRLVERTVPVSTTRVAELIKLLENTFRHVNIALVNELAVHARALGIDIWEAIDATATKPFGYAAFLPGPGVGGHCLPIDPSYLSWRIERQLGRHLPVRRHGQRRQPEHARLRRSAGAARSERSTQGRQRRPHPRARHRLQEEHQ